MNPVSNSHLTCLFQCNLEYKPNLGSISFYCLDKLLEGYRIILIFLNNTTTIQLPIEMYENHKSSQENMKKIPWLQLEAHEINTILYICRYSILNLIVTLAVVMNECQKYLEMQSLPHNQCHMFMPMPLSSNLLSKNEVGERRADSRH